jgi:hypothetical protein
MLPGPATCRNLSRDRASHERSCARGSASDVDVVSLPKVAIIHVLPPVHEQAVVLEARFVPKRGKKTSGLDRFGNGR